VLFRSGKGGESVGFHNVPIFEFVRSRRRAVGDRAYYELTGRGNVSPNGNNAYREVASFIS